MKHLTLVVNDTEYSAVSEDRALLVDFLRDTLGLTGTHVGCDTSQCGACTVHVDGVAVKSCAILAVACDKAFIKTIEGVADGDKLHPLQQAFKDNHGLQCGFCTPGFVMAGLDILRRHGNALTEETLRQELEGNICRCTGYTNIVTAILETAQTQSARSLGQGDV